MASIKPALRVFSDLVALDDKHIQGLLREVEAGELCVALTEASEAIQAKIFRNMSERAAAMIREDMDYMGPVKPGQLRAARQRMLKISRCLQKAGWQPKPQPPRKFSGLAGRLLANLAEKPVACRSAAEMVPLLKGMAELARRDGILELEAVIDVLKDDFTRLGLQLLVDGTDAAVIRETLALRKKALLTEIERKLDVIATGILAMHGGDNPRVVEVKCRACLP